MPRKPTGNPLAEKQRALETALQKQRARLTGLQRAYEERDMLREALRRMLVGSHEPDNVHAAWVLLRVCPSNAAAAERGLASIRAAVEAKKGTL